MNNASTCRRSLEVGAGGGRCCLFEIESGLTTEMMEEEEEEEAAAEEAEEEEALPGEGPSRPIGGGSLMGCSCIDCWWWCCSCCCFCFFSF